MSHMLVLNPPRNTLRFVGAAVGSAVGTGIAIVASAMIFMKACKIDARSRDPGKIPKSAVDWMNEERIEKCKSQSRITQ